MRELIEWISFSQAIRGLAGEEHDILLLHRSILLFLSLEKLHLTKLHPMEGYNLPVGQNASIVRTQVRDGKS